MKTITINENQYKRLFEADGDSIYLNGNDTTARYGSEISTQALMSNSDGEDEMSDPITTNKFADMQSPQQWGSIGGRKSANTI